jgi:hypothetical protein
MRAGLLSGGALLRVTLSSVLFAVLPHVGSAKTANVYTSSKAEVVIRAKRGNSSDLVTARRKIGDKEASTGELSKQIGSVNLWGYASAGRLILPTSDGWQSFPSLNAIARGKNTKDSGANTGDNYTVFSTATLAESLIFEGPRLSGLRLGTSTRFELFLNLHGEIIKEGGAPVATARAEVTFKPPTSIFSQSVAESEGQPQLFDGTRRKIKVDLDVTFQSSVKYSIDLLAVACVAKDKICRVEADLGGTLSLVGLNVQDQDGLRFELPDVRSASGADYTRFTNLPEEGDGVGQFAFASDMVAAEEDQHSVVVRVNRNQGSSGAASVVVRNATTPAVGAGFVPFSTTLQFADGETQKAVAVKLVDDAIGQDGSGTPRQFILELADATGATLAGSRQQMTVTLYDDDALWGGPFPGPASYIATINPGADPSEMGTLSLKIDAKNNCTFKGVLRGAKFAGRGSEGELNLIGGGKTVKVPGIGNVKIVLVRFLTIGSLPRILGTATLPDGTVLPIRGLEHYAKKAEEPGTGKRGDYTVLFEPVAGAPSAAPQGSGFARVKVLDTGKVTFVGKLPDGSPLTGGGSLTALRNLPLHLKAGKGSITGALNFRPGAERSDIDGELRWVRPSTSKPGLFASGFDTTIVANGSQYVRPETEEFLLPSLAVTNAGARFRADSSELAAPLERQVTVDRAPKCLVTVPAPNAEKLAVKLNPQTGLWTGQFSHGGKSAKIQGAVLQKSSRAAGYLIGSTQSGMATIVPSPPTP